MFKGKTYVGLLAGLLIITALLLGISVKPEQSAAGEPAKFASYDEMVNYIEKNTQLINQFDRWYGGVRVGIMADQAMPEAKLMKEAENVAQDAGESSASPDYSRTNNQVQGVDEADLVKTDGKYLYIISSNKLSVIQAYTTSEAKKLSEIKFADQPLEAFINGDTLVVFGNGSDPYKMFIHKYNVADRKNPKLLQDISCDGQYVTSRMIGNNIYTVINTPVYRYDYDNTNEDNKKKIALPRITTNGKVQTIQPSEIYYFDHPDYAYQYTSVISINTEQSSTDLQNKTYLTGTSHNIYASANNIYLTGIKTPDYALYTQKLIDGLVKIVPDSIATKIKAAQDSGQGYAEKLQKVEEILDAYLNNLDYEKALALEDKIAEYRDKWHRDVARERNKTVIYKLAIANGSVEYKCQGEVSGRVLNQFSMDEYAGYFRIATTSEGFLFTDLPATRNNIYVLDENLQVTGSVLGLAPTERIYSARFMGQRAYLVTFRRVDPLFVIDLKDPQNPSVLGELKIPGYSDYLHPYDENHLIGIGREVSAAPMPEQLPGRAIIPPPTREQGVKIALFDVSNPAEPKEVAKYVVDRDDSNSPALYDHRAVLFSKEKNLLAIPITYGAPYRIMVETDMYPYKPDWQGVFVFNISPEQGIKLKGKVEHKNTPYQGKYYANNIKRSLYIEDILYTISDQQVKVNKLDDMRDLKTIKLQ